MSDQPNKTQTLTSLKLLYKLQKTGLTAAETGEKATPSLRGLQDEH